MYFLISQSNPSIGLRTAVVKQGFLLRHVVMIKRFGLSEFTQSADTSNEVLCIFGWPHWEISNAPGSFSIKGIIRKSQQCGLSIGRNTISSSDR